LCGVPSLPFAVGVYLPLSSSTPIFVGGLVRYVADRWARGSTGRRRSEAESDMSPGVLLSTGYIAGGTIGAVIIAFLSFSDTIPNQLGAWEFRHRPVTVEKPLDQQYEDIAVEEAGARGDEEQKAAATAIKQLTAEIADLNESELPKYVQVSKGTVLALPKDAQYTATQNTILGEIALETEHDQDKAALLLDLNRERLRLPDRFPVGAQLKVPQRNGPAVAAFSLLAIVLLLVGLGWLLKSADGLPAVPAPENGKDPMT
jgi:hypothetical protein